MIGKVGLSVPPGNVVGLRLTASVATRRIQTLASQSGSIVLGDAARRQMVAIGFTHPQLAAFLTSAKVTGAPDKLDQTPDAWRCRVEGNVRSAGRGAGVTVVLGIGRIYVEGVEWV